MIKPNWYPDNKQLREFAVACLPGFALIGYAVHKWGASVNTAYVVAAIGMVNGLIGLAIPGAVRWLYLTLMTITLPIGWAVSNVFLRVIFYLILTPLGLVFRLMGRDPLLLKKPAGASYWRDHPQRADAASYYRQA